MTDIERIASLAGLQSDGLRWYSRGPGKYDDQDVTHADLTRFAELVRADERAARQAEVEHLKRGIGCAMWFMRGVDPELPSDFAKCVDDWNKLNPDRPVPKPFDVIRST